jgi:hypothetical protein
MSIYREESWCGGESAENCEGVSGLIEMSETPTYSDNSKEIATQYGIYSIPT